MRGHNLCFNEKEDKLSQNYYCYPFLSGALRKYFEISVFEILRVDYILFHTFPSSRKESVSPSRTLSNS